MFHPYRVLLSTPSIKPAYAAVLLSAVPLGMVTLALVLSVDAWTGSLVLAGSTAGLFTFSNAVGLTVQGRLMDRLGSRVVVLPAGLVSGAALTGLGLAGEQLRPEILGGVVVVAGLSVPAITTAVRRALPGVVADAAVRSTAYALLSVAFQIAFAVGPVLVSAAVLVGGASLAFPAAAAALLAASLLLAGSHPAARSRPTACRVGAGAPDPRRGFWAAPAGLIHLYGVAAVTGIANGVMVVAVPAITTGAGLAVIAGLVFTATAVGDVVGALAFGSRRWPLTPVRQLRAALGLAALVAIGMFAASGNPWLLVPLAVLGGIVGAPAAIQMSALLDDLAPAEQLGTAYSALVSIGLVAAAAGNTSAGALSTILTPQQLLLGPPLLLGIAALTTTWLRPSHPTPDPQTDR